MSYFSASTCNIEYVEEYKSGVQGRAGEFTHVLNGLVCLLSTEFFDSMVGDSYLSFDTSHNTLLNMVWTKSVIRKCVIKISRAAL
jgi:hypothetical protein